MRARTIAEIFLRLLLFIICVILYQKIAIYNDEWQINVNAFIKWKLLKYNKTARLLIDGQKSWSKSIVYFQDFAIFKVELNTLVQNTTCTRVLQHSTLHILQFHFKGGCGISHGQVFCPFLFSRHFARHRFKSCNVCSYFLVWQIPPCNLANFWYQCW